MKKILALTLCVLLTVGMLAGCGGSGAGDDASGNLTVALVVAGTFGDRSFYDSSKEGCDRLAQEGVTVKTIECNNENHMQQIYNAADAADVVVLVGWEFYDVETIAPEYPNVKFIWIDNATSAPVANVLNITYAQNEGSFLAGYIAAKLSQSGVIGVVGGEDSDTINDFVVGYKQGAQYANPDCKVEVQYANTYDDPAVGKECALALSEKGADVVFQVASKTGDGVFEAAKEGGFYAIGVDSDQKYIADDVIVCSMCKQVGESIYQAIKQYQKEGDACTLWGTTWVADMASGLVGIGYGEEGSQQQVSDELKSEVDGLAKKIIDGEIVVDTTR
ncbi:MAG: BMP family ABC transporter substrate-binding protein [Clostridiales bacterium]|nr:BMP family ABC transporter substrate-binding protein [Clostridiales bacterium]MDD7386705.1 BMP family ABC transporter substrate-binding protein [Bacillota bacterium]MDY6040755.1 BMP family ABC transporter substrate-binding protein [Candidatus Faecousia sp.]